MEKRRYTRVRLALGAAIACGDVATEGDVRDLSVHGAFVSLSANAFVPGQAVEVAIRLVAARPLPPLRCQAIVARVDAEGVALEFGRMSMESLGQLRNLVAYHAGDGEKIARELARYLDP